MNSLIARAKFKLCIASKPLTHYVIVRADLPLGFQAAQIVHAAGESVSSPLPPNTHAVVLAVPDEVTLRMVHRRLGLAGVPHVLVQEVDPPFTGQATAIGLVPLRDRDVVKPFFSSLPLLR